VLGQHDLADEPVRRRVLASVVEHELELAEQQRVAILVAAVQPPAIVCGRIVKTYENTTGSGCQPQRSSKSSKTVPRSSVCVTTSRTVIPCTSSSTGSPSGVTV
jgi:hypothetical protein